MLPLAMLLEWSDIKKNQGELLNMAEEIAKAKKIKIIFCIDEFQNIAYFEDPLSFQKLLRAYWQNIKMLPIVFKEVSDI